MSNLRNKMIEELMVEGWLKRTILNFIKKDEMLADDLVQDIAVAILTYPNDKIDEAYNNNQHKFFITRIIMNQVNSSTSKFYDTYRKHNHEDIDNHFELL